MLTHAAFIWSPQFFFTIMEYYCNVKYFLVKYILNVWIFSSYYASVQCLMILQKSF